MPSPLTGEAWQLIGAPGHQVFDAALGMAIEDGAEGGCDVVERIDVGHFTGGDQQGENGPVFDPDVVTRCRVALNRHSPSGLPIEVKFATIGTAIKHFLRQHVCWPRLTGYWHAYLTATTPSCGLFDRLSGVPSRPVESVLFDFRHFGVHEHDGGACKRRTTAQDDYVGRLQNRPPAHLEQVGDDRFQDSLGLCFVIPCLHGRYGGPFLVRPHPVELQARVVGFVEEGGGHREAARHFRVSPKFVNDMVKLKPETGGLDARRQGHRGWSKLAGVGDWIGGVVNTRPELMLNEIRDALAQAHDLHVHRGTVEDWLHRLGLIPEGEKGDSVGIPKGLIFCFDAGALDWRE